MNSLLEHNCDVFPSAPEAHNAEPYTVQNYIWTK